MNQSKKQRTTLHPIWTISGIAASITLFMFTYLVVTVDSMLSAFITTLTIAFMAITALVIFTIFFSTFIVLFSFVIQKIAEMKELEEPVWTTYFDGDFNMLNVYNPRYWKKAILGKEKKSNET